MSEDSWQIDTQRFSERGERREGLIGPKALPRLREESLSKFDPVEVSVLGVRTPRGKAGIRLSMHAVIQMQCQRCLKSMKVELNPTAALEWVSTDAEMDAGDEDDEWDTVMAGGQVDLLPILEDELLLMVPYAPLHEACKPGGAAEAGIKASPFAALAALKAQK